MTSQKEIINVQNILNGTTESAISAAQELSKIPGILRGFESIGLDKIEITKKDDLQNYLANLDLLGQKAQNAAGHLVTLSSDMSQTANSYKEGLANGTRFNSKLYEQELGMTSLTEAQKKLILQQSGLITNTGKYTIAQTDLVQAAVEGTETFSKLGDAEKQEVTAAIAATTAKQGQKVATESLTAAQTALNVAMGVGKQLLIAIAVAGAVFIIQKVVQWVQSLTKSVDELESAAASAKNEYESLNGTLEDYRSQLDDIIAKKKDVRDGKIIDPAEITEIDNQNEYIRAQIKLYESLLEEKAKVANQNAWEAANSKDYTSLKNNYSVENDPNGVGAGEVTKIDRYDALDERIDKYNQLSTSLANLSKAYNDGTISQSEYNTRSAALTTQMENLDSEISNIYSDISDNFNSAIDDSSEKYQQLKADTDAATQSYLAFKDATDRTAESAEEAGDSLKNSWDVDTTGELAQFMESLSDSSSDLYAKTKALTSAYNDMYTSQKLSSDSIQSLIAAYPELISQMETENGVTTISKDVLCEKFDAMKGAMVATIESEIQATQTAIAEAQTRIATYQSEIKALVTLYSAIGTVAAGMKAGTYGSYEQYDNMPEDMRNAAQRYIELNDAMADANKTLDDANAKLADQKKALDVLNNLTLPNYAGATKGASAANKGATKAAKENKKALEAQKKEAEKTKKALENYSKTLKAQGDAIIKVLDKRKDALEKEKDARDKAWDKQKEQLEEEKKLKDKAYEKEKEALQEKKQALQDANDEEDRAIKLAQLQDALAKAQSQRTKRVYQHDTGFEWQVDESAVSDAQNNLDDQQRAWKREDAIAAVEKEIDAIDKLKDAYDEEVEAAIDAIEKQKDAYDDSIDAQIDKIEEMKDKYQEVLDLIGMSWEEYQAMLDATAIAEGMSLDSMGEYLVGFKENVVQNMKEIADAEAEVQRLTDAISGIDTSSSGSGGGGGGGGGAGIPGLGNAAFTASEKLQGLIKSIKESTDNISKYKEEEEALCQKLSDGNLTTSERVTAMTELSGKQAQIRDEEANLTDLAGQYVIALGEETDATDAYREAAILQLGMLTDGYNLSYDTIFNTLQKHLEDVENTNSGTSELYDSMSQTVDLFSQNVTGTLNSLGGNFDTLVQKVQKAAEQIEKTCRSAIENIKKMNQEANNAGSGTKHHALGTRSVVKPGRSLVDEEGPELIVRQSKSNGRYTYLERGDQVLPASYSKNLWDMGSNPSEWFEKQYSKFSRLDTKAVYAGGTTIYSPAFSGDIVITNPVGNSDDLARGLKQNLPTSFMQALGVRS